LYTAQISNGISILAISIEHRTPNRPPLVGFAVWSAAMHELLLLGGDDRIIVASYIIQGDSFMAGVARVW
jgi:hypothetical protein